MDICHAEHCQIIRSEISPDKTEMLFLHPELGNFRIFKEFLTIIFPDYFGYENISTIPVVQIITMAVLDQERINHIKQILKWHPRGMTISDINSQVKMNRNLVAKYLDMLLISGHVEMQVVGAAKVYYIATTVPVSAILEFSSDLVIMIDRDRKIIQVNEQVPQLFNEKKVDIVGKRIDEIHHPLIHDLPVDSERKDKMNECEIISERNCIIGGEKHHFRIKRVPTTFEDGTQGFTFIIEDITAQKKYQEMLQLSEAKYRGLVKSSGEAIIGTTTEGRIVSWNPAAERLFGYTESEVGGKPLTLLTEEIHYGDIDGLLNGILQGDCIQRRELRMTGRNNNPIDALITICPIKGEENTITGASAIIRDITQEKIEQHMREHEDKYRTRVEDLNVGFYRSTGDPRGRFVWGNIGLLQILGFPSISDLQEINVVDVFLKPDGRKELIDELLRSGFVKNRIVHLKKQDGTPVSVSVTALAEFDENKNLIFINGIVQDITGFVNHDGLPAQK
jgi:PAS domain S-box-containing protein